MVNKYLVGGFSNLEKYEFVNGKEYPIYDMKHKKCLKPPTSIDKKMNDKMIEYTTNCIWACLKMAVTPIMWPLEWKCNDKP